MSAPSALTETVELLLAATFSTRQDGRRVSFLFGRPGAPHFQRNLGTEVYFAKVPLLKAALHVRQNGPVYLRNLSIHEVEGALIDVLTENYWLICNDTWLKRWSDAFVGHVSAEAKAALAEALARSDIFAPRAPPTLFPLVPFKVEADFYSEPFFLIKPASLDAKVLRRELHPRDLSPARFPPFPDWQGVRYEPGAWLGVRSPTLSVSKKMRNAILGATALLPHPRERHLFTGRKTFGGHSTLDGGWSTTLGEAHTPALSENLVIGDYDRAWLSILAAKLEDGANESRKHVRALEYYYRAWPLDDVERFPILFMAIDAIFGSAAAATQSVIDAVGPLMGPKYDQTRLRLLLGLRGSVIHGGAPDVYDSSKYVAYYETYAEDPIYDLELIAARCLQQVIFAGTLTSRPHTHADLIKKEWGVDI